MKKMEKLVIYATKRGSSKKYAEAFAQKHGYPVYEQGRVPSEDFAGSKKLYYFGSVYAGRVFRLNKLKEKCREDMEITVVPVGLSSKNDQEKMVEIRKGIIKTFPEAEIFYMRGRLSYKELSFPEKILIKMINKESNKKEFQNKLDIEKAIEQVVAEDGVDFINLNELEVIE